MNVDEKSTKSDKSKKLFSYKDLSDKVLIKTSRFSCKVMNKLYYKCKGFLFTDCCVDSYKSEYSKV